MNGETPIESARRSAKWIYSNQAGPVWWNFGALTSTHNSGDPSNPGLTDDRATLVWGILEKEGLIGPYPPGTPGIPAGSYRLLFSSPSSWTDFMHPPGLLKRLWRKLPAWLWGLILFILGGIANKYIEYLLDP